MPASAIATLIVSGLIMLLANIIGIQASLAPAEGHKNRDLMPLIYSAKSYLSVVYVIAMVIITALMLRDLFTVVYTIATGHMVGRSLPLDIIYAACVSILALINPFVCTRSYDMGEQLTAITITAGLFIFACIDILWLAITRLKIVVLFGTIHPLPVILVIALVACFAGIIYGQLVSSLTQTLTR